MLVKLNDCAHRSRHIIIIISSSSIIYQYTEAGSAPARSRMVVAEFHILDSEALATSLILQCNDLKQKGFRIQILFAVIWIRVY
jgi:hypothetical protein